MIVTKSTEAPKLEADLGHRSMRWRPQKMFSFLDEVEKDFWPIFDISSQFWRTVKNYSKVEERTCLVY